MLDFSYVAHRVQCPPAEGRRVLVLVDPHATQPSWVKAWLHAHGTPLEVSLLWVVTPSALMTWGALSADPMERTSVLLAALGERMERAHRKMAPLRQAYHAAQIPCTLQVVHGPVVESVARIAAEACADQVLLPPTTGTGYGHAPAELAALLARQIACPVVLLD
jgi:hypothetical protein